MARECFITAESCARSPRRRSSFSTVLKDLGIDGRGSLLLENREKQGTPQFVQSQPLSPSSAALAPGDVGHPPLVTNWTSNRYWNGQSQVAGYYEICVKDAQTTGNSGGGGLAGSQGLGTQGFWNSFYTWDNFVGSLEGGGYSTSQIIWWAPLPDNKN
jgi:hypothetical protein